MRSEMEFMSKKTLLFTFPFDVPSDELKRLLTGKGHTN